MPDATLNSVSETLPDNLQGDSWLNTSEFTICNFFPLTPDSFTPSYIDGDPVTFSDLELLVSESTVRHAYNQTDSGSLERWVEDESDYDEDPDVLRVLDIFLEVLMSNLAASLNHLSLQTNNCTIQGTAYTSLVVIEVRWHWLTLPALLVFSGNFFLLSTIRASRKLRVSLWESSVLAPLYHGLHPVSVDTSDNSDNRYRTVSSMESASESVKIRLEHSDQHKRLMLQQQTDADMASDESVDSDTIRSEQSLSVVRSQSLA
jgi:hypothetical protein